MKATISCDLHDYLEIACMYKIQVSLVLTDGRYFKGSPITTSINAEKEECLLFLPDSSEIQVSIPLYLLEKMEAVTHNVHFNTVVFKESY